MKINTLTTLLHQCRHAISQRYLSVMLLLWGTSQSVLANGPDITKLPKFTLPGVENNETDVTKILFIIGKSIVLLLAILLAAGVILMVVRSLMNAYSEATSENAKRGWGHFIVVLIVGFIMIFFTLYLVRLAAGMF